MQLVVLVLNKTECLEELLEKFVEINVKGATIIESSGMAKALYNDSHTGILFSVPTLFVDGIHPGRATRK